jgi:hypothetical protein
VEEFVSCGVWLLSASVDFEHVKVDLTSVSWLKVPLPRFPLFHKDGEDDTRLLVRVKQEARNIIDNYTCTEHEACIASLTNNGCLNHMLEIAGVAYGPRSVPISPEVLKKRKADAATKVLAKRLNVYEKKGAELAKVSRVRASGGSKRPSGAYVLPAKSVKLSNGTVPCAIASATMACIMPETRGPKDLLSASGSKSGGKRPGCKIVPRAKATPSAKKCIAPAIGALAAMSSGGLRNRLRTTRRLRFSRRQVLAARRWSLKLDL